MFISDTAIKRPVLTIVAMLVLVVFGIVALLQLDTDEFPEIDAPVVVVAIPYPGASPDVVEREVIEPIEEVISGISGVDRMTSSSLDSFGNIIVEFVFEKDPQQATQEIRDKISGIRNDLPTEMEEPILTRFDPADQPIVSLTLSSPGLTGAELTRHGRSGHHAPAARHLRRGVRWTSSAASSASWSSRSGRATCRRPASASRRSCRRCSRRTWPSPVGRLEGELDERTIRLQGPARGAGRLQAADGVAVERPHRPPRRRRRRARRHRGAALGRALQRRGSGRHRHRQVHAASAPRRWPTTIRARGRRDSARRCRPA